MNFVEFLNKTPYYTSKVYQYGEGTPPAHSYAPGYYIDAFADRYAPINILEIGIYNGESLRIWDDWFVNGNIYGLDIDCTSLDRARDKNLSNRVHLFCGDAYSQEVVDTFEDNFFDFVIEDGSHVPQQQRDAVNLWLPKIKSGGKMIVEDVAELHNAELLVNSIDSNRVSSSKIFDLRHISNYHWNDDILVEFVRV
jgi:predicted O-methyltransferase YrrM